jgi:predicted TIM-barrel fold metal-dependent hydrolase
MKIEDMVIISSDDHIIEPPDLFKNHLDKKWQDGAPKLVTFDDGAQRWVYDGIPQLSCSLNAVVGRVPEELGFEPTNYDQMRKSCWDVHARIDDMNVDGIAASMCYGSMSLLAGETFIKSKDHNLGLAVVKAYNDWHVDEWCATAPDRFIPLMLLPLWSMEETVKEVKRNVAKGVKNLTFLSLPTHLGLPSIHNEYWYPLWTVCQDEGVTVNIHITADGGQEHVSPDSPVSAWINKVGMSAMTVMCEWLWSDTIKKFDKLKFVLSESGAGWLPYFLERADLTQRVHGPWTHQGFGDKLPSEFFRERFASTFIQDFTGLSADARKWAGVENLLVECDFPHADVAWPYTPEVIFKAMQANNLSDHEINLVTHRNAERWFQFNELEKRGRENYTVGALRAKATHIDTTPQSIPGWRPGEKGKGVTAADIMNLIPSFYADERTVVAEK